MTRALLSAAALLVLALALPSCATLQQVAALRNVDFAYNGVSDVRLAGISIGDGRSYASLADLHTKSIIHANPTDPMEKHHQACSARGCHAGQTENGPAKACEKCHPEL